MVPRMLETASTRSCWMGPLARDIADSAVPVADLAAAGPAFSAASTSARTMRPPGPEPWMFRVSIPLSWAIFLARGEIFTRPCGPAPAGVGEGAGPTGTGCGAGAGVGAGATALAGAAAGAATLGALAGASTTSPGFPIAQRAAPIAICEPSGAKIFTSVPSKNDSSSMVALSVSTSASMSPLFTASPSFFFHLTSVPTVMVSLSFGISMIWAIGRLGLGIVGVVAL